MRRHMVPTRCAARWTTGRQGVGALTAGHALPVFMVSAALAGPADASRWRGGRRRACVRPVVHRQVGDAGGGGLCVGAGRYARLCALLARDGEWS